MPLGVAGFSISTINQNQRKKIHENPNHNPGGRVKRSSARAHQSHRQVRTLPVLQTVRINRNQEGIVTLHATDLDSFVTYTAKATQPGSPAEVLVPVDQLTKATKCSSPKAEIGIVPEGKDKVKLRYNIAGNMVEQTISTCAADEFPRFPRSNSPASNLSRSLARRSNKLWPVAAKIPAVTCCGGLAWT